MLPSFLTDFVSSVLLLGSLGTGGQTPFWATANQYGIMPESSGALLVAQASMPYDTSRVVQWHWGASLAGRNDRFSTFQVIPDELYGGIKWKVLSLNLGIWHRDKSFLASDPLLGSISSTSGNIAWSGNSRSVPGYEIRLSPWSVPGTKGVLELMAAFGDYRTIDKRYIQGPWLHNTAFGFRINIQRFSLLLGIDHWSLWGGTSPDYGRMSFSFSDYIRVCLGMPGSSRHTLSDQLNVYGDHRGQEFITFSWKGNGWRLTLQDNIPYDDMSGIRFQNFPDATYTLNFSFDDKNKWVSDIAYEFIYTMCQSGPIHDRTATPEEIIEIGVPPDDFFYGRAVPGGMDNYFNNGEYKTAWTMFGRTIGTPLILPAGTLDGTWNRNQVCLGVESNLVKGHHFGMSGKLFRKIPYKLMLTYFLSYGCQYIISDGVGGVSWLPAKWQFCSGFNTIIPLLKDSLQIIPSIFWDRGDSFRSGLGATLGIRYNFNSKIDK